MSRAGTPIEPDTPAPDFRPGRIAAFVAVAVLLWVGLFAGSEGLMRHLADENPVYRIRAAPTDGSDWIVLGASHAMPLDFQGFGDEIARRTGQSVLNLAVPGTGPLYHRFLAERFFASHRAENVLVVVDSFAFYDRQWNEDRFSDRDLLARTPLDAPTLRLYARYLRHGVDPRGFLDYATGFSKINNHDRFEPDRWEAEENFDRTIRPSAHADQERIAYLYPEPPDVAALARYLDHLVALIRDARAAGAEVVVIKPPIPERFAALLPGEDDFDAALTARLGAEDVRFHDFTEALPDPGFYFDADHLNRQGAETFLEEHLGPLLIGTDAGGNRDAGETSTGRER